MTSLAVFTLGSKELEVSIDRESLRTRKLHAGDVLHGFTTPPDRSRPLVPLSPTRLPSDTAECMEPFNLRAAQILSDEQLDTLVSIVLDEYGPTLARVRFNDVILSLFEFIAGLDNLPQKRRERYLTVLWSKYRKAIRSTGVH